MTNNRSSNWRPIENLEAYKETRDHNLQYLENLYVEEINNTPVRVVNEAVDKYSSRRDIKTAKLN